jgi:hypothetical protein
MYTFQWKEALDFLKSIKFHLHWFCSLTMEHTHKALVVDANTIGRERMIPWLVFCKSHSIQ